MKMMREGFEGWGLEVDAKGRQTIEINGGYTGYHYQYDVQEEEIVHWTNTYWNADGMLYICLSSADEANSKEVMEALQM